MNKKSEAKEKGQ